MRGGSTYNRQVAREVCFFNGARNAGGGLRVDFERDDAEVVGRGGLAGEVGGESAVGREELGDGVACVAGYEGCEGRGVEGERGLMQ
jgi:hypothetical protein